MSSSPGRALGLSEVVLDVDVSELDLKAGVDRVSNTLDRVSNTLRKIPPSWGILGSHIQGRGMSIPEISQSPEMPLFRLEEVSRITTRAFMVIHGIGIYLPVTLLIGYLVRTYI